jgi:hypothetical protein
MQRFSSFKNPTSIIHNRPLSDDDIRRVAPSIFAEGAHDSRSSRYTYIPTIDVLNGLRKEGFQPFMAAQTRVRDDSKREHAKHMLRLRRSDAIGVSETKEIVLLNSHDGTSSYQLIAGIFRFVCANGHIFGDTMSDVRVHHKGDIINDVIEGAFEVMQGFSAIDESLEQMKTLTLKPAEKEIFARAALSLRYDEQTPAPITERDVLQPRRQADRESDLWRTFNVVQENMIQGGIRGRATTGKRTTTRPVSGIDQNIKLNRALWLLADQMAKLKG